MRGIPWKPVTLKHRYKILRKQICDSYICVSLTQYIIRSAQGLLLCFSETAININGTELPVTAAMKVSIISISDKSQVLLIALWRLLSDRN